MTFSAGGQGSDALKCTAPALNPPRLQKQALRKKVSADRFNLVCGWVF